MTFESTFESVRRPGRHGGAAHAALLYGSPGEFARVAGALFAEGRAAGAPTVAVLAPGTAEVLHDRLGADGVEDVEFLDAGAWFRTPVQALGDLEERARASWWPRGTLRVLAEPVWAGRAAREVREWKRLEALLNVALAGTPTRLMCAYDTRSLPTPVLADAARTHPELVDGAGARPSGGFVDPGDFCARCDAEPLPDPPAGAACRAFATGGLPDVREFLALEAARLGVPGDRSLPFVLAVNEVVTMALREGGGAAEIRVWAEGGELVGDVLDPRYRLAAGYFGLLPPGAPAAAGAPPRARAHAHRRAATMWAVRRLCSLVEIRTGAHGTRVRLRVPR
ncbi:MEDS domain-containing protein [Actinomadura atramentaria]|uniref:MEDS domain-containing protein n=1 Tax=Actinomadura atramentaria TaxID=1990 RepID=UPI0003617134|nr:MEDS domain-containing protein [Actinomadura atramentaria]